jgi:hypothetical protein
MRRPLIGAKDFEAFIGQGEQAQGRSLRLTKEERSLVYVGKKKERRVKCKKKISSCVERCLWEGCEKMKHGRKLCVASNCSEASGLLV